MGEWTYGLCGCFSDCTLCLITYIAPCYTAGKNAEGVGDSCMKVGACYYIFPIFGIYLVAKAREKIREQHGIEGKRSKMGEWANGLCGCFNDCTLCIITYFLPCYTAGKNAEAVGDSCITVGALYAILPIVGVFFVAKVREKIREQNGIDGSFGMDCLMHLFCPLCALVQDANQLKQSGQATQAESMARE